MHELKTQFIQYIHNECVGDLSNINSQIDLEQISYYIGVNEVFR
jgi:hypothetical protein